MCNCKAVPQSKVNNLTTVPFKSHIIFHISSKYWLSSSISTHKKIGGYTKKPEFVPTRAPYQ